MRAATGGAKRIRNEKVVLIGAASSGKTSITTRFAHDKFDPNSTATVGAAFLKKSIKVDNQEIQLDIWDTGGSEKYKSLAPMYYRDTQAAIIVFDLTAPASLNDAKMWLDELKQHGPPKCIISLAANKADLAAQREIKDDEIQTFISQNQFDFFNETSAMNGQNIDKLFTEISEKLLNVVESEIVDDDNSKQVILDSPQPPQNTKKCSLCLERNHDHLASLRSIFISANSAGL